MESDPVLDKKLFSTRCHRFYELNSFPNFFQKSPLVSPSGSSISSSMDILTSDYGFDSNVINCKLFESDTPLNQSMGLTPSILEQFEIKNQIEEEKVEDIGFLLEDEDKKEKKKDIEVTNQVMGISTWSGQLYIKLILNQEPYISEKLAFNLPGNSQFCGGCTDFDFTQDFLSDDNESLKLISVYGNGVIRLWSLGKFIFTTYINFWN